jgi:hypothetical protein
LSFQLPAVSRAELRELEALLRAGAEQASCVGALLGPSAPAPHPGPLAWEILTGQTAFSETLALTRHHVRAPGWLTLAPGAAAQRVAGAEGVEVTKVASGALLRSRAESPGAMSDADREAMERAVLPALAPRPGPVAPRRPT